MEKQELYSLFEKAFPFWGDISDSDKETFCRSSQSVCSKKGTNIDINTAEIGPKNIAEIVIITSLKSIVRNPPISGILKIIIERYASAANIATPVIFFSFSICCVLLLIKKSSLHTLCGRRYTMPIFGIFISSLIRTLPSVQEFHLLGSFELADFNRRYGISPIPKDIIKRTFLVLPNITVPITEKPLLLQYFI